MWRLRDLLIEILKKVQSCLHEGENIDMNIGKGFKEVESVWQ